MTLITSPSSLNNLYNYSCTNNHSTEDNYTLAPTPALSWLQPATTPSAATPSFSHKYRTLASIQAQTLQQQLQQQQQHLSTLPPLSPITTKPCPLDSQSQNEQQQYNNVALFKQELSSSITDAIQEMDNSHGTCFLPWIHNPANLDYISLRLRPLCLEYPLVDVANVLRWIGADWSSVDCKALFRAVTQSWDQGKRRMLAFLLIRDEEMRQKAKSKLVEFAQKSNCRTSKSHHHQLRRSSQLQPQQQHRPRPFQHQQHPQTLPLHRLQSKTKTLTPATSHLSATTSASVSESVAVVVAVQEKLPIDLATLEKMVAASMITGMDVIVPTTTTNTTSSTTTTTTTTTTITTTSICASNNATAGSSYQRRYSPY
ncbi:hypothetical protein BGX28_000648 [Mortierella sp. GBA30]|nr:hypothetical protein BGX28_000648 [Mortierella sp. GBA30]